ncbi:MAG: DUF5700 domain-containing putative Zn-dependent protease [Bacteroidota bacterium]
MKSLLLVNLLCFLANMVFAQIKFDYTGADVVIDYFLNDKKENIPGIINHPGYLHVFEHSKKYSSTPLDQESLKSSLSGQSNGFDYTNIDERLDTLRQIITNLKANEQLMNDDFGKLTLRYLPNDYKQNAAVFFIAGGYNGIAMGGKIAMNIDWKQFRKDKQEIFLYLSHELFHIGFEQYQTAPDVFSIKTVDDLKKIIMYYTMNEGIATLVPYEYRIMIDAIKDYDYSVLTDSALLSQKLQQFNKLMKEIEVKKDSLISNELLNKALGECSGDRLFYIAGCYMGHKIERKHGRSMLIELIKKSPAEFFEVFDKIE